MEIVLKNLIYHSFERFESHKGKKLQYWVNKDYDWILSQPSLTKQTVFNQYTNAHYEKDLKCTREVIVDLCPEYLKAFDIVMSNKGFSAYNMCYTKRYHYINYCEWLFKILFELENRIDISMYDKYQKKGIWFYC